MVVVAVVRSVVGIWIDCNSAFSLILHLLSIFLSVPKVVARDISVRNRDSGPYAAGTGRIVRAHVRSGAQNRAGSDVCGAVAVDVAVWLWACKFATTRVSAYLWLGGYTVRFRILLVKHVYLEAAYEKSITNMCSETYVS